MASVNIEHAYEDRTPRIHATLHSPGRIDLGLWWLQSWIEFAFGKVLVPRWCRRGVLTEARIVSPLELSIVLDFLRENSELIAQAIDADASGLEAMKLAIAAEKGVKLPATMLHDYRDSQFAYLRLLTDWLREAVEAGEHARVEIEIA